MLIVEPPTVLVGSRGLSSAAALGARRAAPPARIGPNTIIQLAHVLRDRFGDSTASTLLFESTGYAMGALPAAMVDEREAQAFVQTVMRSLGEDRGAQVLHEAGHRTATYLMANRIPRPAQLVMKLLPQRAGLVLLLKAMQANAWTFAGSGSFGVKRTPKGAELTFHACAMCRDMHSEGPVCDFYAGTFEHLIRSLVAPRATVREVECQALGAHCCRFEVITIH
jgi:divinyl protochlorophyllide a 8-vinyl-reductase